MKTQKIADDPVNGTHQKQFRWCSENGFTKNPGPVLTGDEWQPLFKKIKRPLKIQTIECGKFGGMCSSKRCREEHMKLAMQ